MSIRSRNSLAIAVGLVFAWLPAQVARADNASVAFANVSRSLALVAAPLPKNNFAFGTAFCIASDQTTSYWLTNAHVVGSHDVVALALPNGDAKPTVVKAML